MGLMQLLLDQAFLQKLPASGTFELTGRCNLDCRMCYIHKKENDAAALAAERPTAFWLDLIAQLKQAGTLTLLLTGGEPFLRRDFQEIFLAVKRAGIVPSINTNGSLLRQEDLDFFAKYPPAKINVSLYGASPETYERLCGHGGVYHRVTENIQALHALKIPLRINYTVTQFNREDAAAVHAFARELGVRVQSATYMFPPTRTCQAACPEASRMSPEDAAQAAVACMQHALSREEFLARAAAYAQGAALPEASDPDPDSLRSPTERIRCRGGSSAFWITYDGRLLPCGMMQKPSFSLRELPFCVAWKQLQNATDQILLPGKCTHCALRPYCEVCAANCYAEGLRFDAVPEYLCKKTEATVRLMAAIHAAE